MVGRRFGLIAALLVGCFSDPGQDSSGGDANSTGTTALTGSGLTSAGTSPSAGSSGAADSTGTSCDTDGCQPIPIVWARHLGLSRDVKLAPIGDQGVVLAGTFAGPFELVEPPGPPTEGPLFIASTDAEGSATWSEAVHHVDELVVLGVDTGADNFGLLLGYTGSFAHEILNGFLPQPVGPVFHYALGRWTQGPMGFDAQCFTGILTAGTTVGGGVTIDDDDTLRAFITGGAQFAFDGEPSGGSLAPAPNAFLVQVDGGPCSFGLSNTGDRSSTLVGGDGNDHGLSIAVDPSGRVLAAGAYSDTPTEPDIMWPAASGMLDGFALFDKVELATLRTTGEAWPLDAAPHPDGGFVIAGVFSGDLTLLGETYPAVGVDAFVARIDARNNVSWFQPISGSLDDAAVGVAVGDGGVAVVGAASDGTDFGGGPVQGSGDRDAFLALYGSAGALLGAQLLGTTAQDAATDVTLVSGVLHMAVLTAGPTDFGVPVDGDQGPAQFPGENTFLLRYELPVE